MKTLIILICFDSMDFHKLNSIQNRGVTGKRMEDDDTIDLDKFKIFK